MLFGLQSFLACQVAAAAVPATMKAGALTKRPWDMQLHLENLMEVEVDVPTPGDDEVLVKVSGSAVNPVDWKLIQSPLALAWSYPHVFGRDCAGTVAAVGASETRLKVGDAVWADTTGEGCYGEYVAIKAAAVGIAPSNIPLAHAAVLPLVSLTGLEAYQFADAPWTEGKTVLVLGGSGGAGHVGIQLAKAFGAATVITTCGTSHVDFCTSMGADQVIDYHKDDFHTVIPARSVDVVYDCVGQAGTGDLAYDILKDGGAYVTLLDSLASAATAASRPSIKQQTFLTDSSDYHQLDILKDFVEAGKLTPSIGSTFHVSDFASAFSESMSHHATGKIVVIPSAPAVAV